MKHKRKRVDVSEESMKDLMQETYNEIVDERNKAMLAYKKFSKDINENNDIALVGKVTNDLLKIIDGTIEKKLRLIKIQSDIIYKNKSNTDSDSTDIVLSESDKKWAEEFIKQQKNANETNSKEYD